MSAIELGHGDYLVWSATYESGTHSDFNSVLQTENNGVLTVTNTFAHSGQWSGYYYRIGSPGNVSRAYPSHELSTPLERFRLEIWVYVPSTVSG